jgi:nucleotide-binding universal stress UspA family protein
MTANIWTNPQGQTRLLLPVDGSEPSLRAVDHAMALAQTLSAPASIVLLNVQSRFSGDVQLFIGGDELHRYHEDEGRKQLAAAEARVAAAGLASESHIVIGAVVESIDLASEQYDCQAIVIGGRGLGGIAGVLLGSVANQLLQVARRPVILVR